MVGQFKDDQVQDHSHMTHQQASSGERGYWYDSNFAYIGNTMLTDDMYNGRRGSITRGKRKGVKYIIKVL